MSPLTSPSQLKFLLDEKVKRRLVTNDSDFTDSVLFPKEKVFSVIWLRIPQNEPESLLKSFSRLLNEKEAPEDFEGKLIVLKKEGFEAYPMLSTTS